MLLFLLDGNHGYVVLLVDSFVVHLLWISSYLSSVCFRCGYVGHKLEVCLLIILASTSCFPLVVGDLWMLKQPFGSNAPSIGSVLVLERDLYGPKIKNGRIESCLT